MSIHRHSMRA